MESTTFELAETIKLDGNNTLNVYQDHNLNVIAFRDCDEPFLYILDVRRTSPCYQDENILNTVVEKYVEQGIRQHEYEGGFEEATKFLEVDFSS
ncbi:MAG: hypothetical protein P8J32_04650 [bacterium]|nr:hypothetical protein [bacterium]